jgi:hypothetical protein
MQIVVPKNWLSTLDNYIQSSNVNMIAGAVTYDCKNSFLHFQQLDLEPARSNYRQLRNRKGFMCNGANLAYKNHYFKN